jgi:hypothetical protein
MSDAERKKNIRRTALIATMVVLAFYIGFILSGVLRA